MRRHMLTERALSTTIPSSAFRVQGFRTHRHSCSQAINIHHDVIREVLVDHGAYEVKTIGDAFMIGCSSATQMVDVATDIQLRLNASQWPLQITLDARDNGQDPALWNGLRVRIGMHWGDPTVYVDPVVGSVDYYGSTVNCASRVEAVGAGGQIVCTAQTFDQVQKETKDKIEHYLAQKKYSFQPLKQVRLRGISGLVDLYQVMHTAATRPAPSESHPPGN